MKKKNLILILVLSLLIVGCNNQKDNTTTTIKDTETAKETETTKETDTAKETESTKETETLKETETVKETQPPTEKTPFTIEIPEESADAVSTFEGAMVHHISLLELFPYENIIELNISDDHTFDFYFTSTKPLYNLKIFTLETVNEPHIFLKAANEEYNTDVFHPENAILVVSPTPAGNFASLCVQFTDENGNEHLATISQSMRTGYMTLLDASDGTVQFE